MRIQDRRWEYVTADGERSKERGIMLSHMEWHPAGGTFMPAKFTSIDGTEWYFNGGANVE